MKKNDLLLLLIALLVIMMIWKVFSCKENFDLKQEKCVTITDPNECRMTSGCAVGKHNTCVTQS